MATTATFGGTVYQLETPNFKTIKALWPVIQKAQNTADPIEAVSLGIEIVSIVALKTYPELTVDGIEERLLGPEAKLLKDTVRAVMIDSGLIDADGSTEGKAEEEAETPSTGTSTE